MKTGKQIIVLIEGADKIMPSKGEFRARMVPIMESFSQLHSGELRMGCASLVILFL